MIEKVRSLKKNQGFVKYFFNTSWLFAEQILRILSGIFVGVWVARYLGPEQFGVFSYVLAFTAIFAGVSKLGLDAILVRELINSPVRKAEILGTSYWLKFFAASTVVFLIGVSIPFTSNDSQTNLYILIISIGLIFQSFEVVDFYFQSQVLARLTSICKVVQLTLSSIIKVVLVLMEADLLSFVVVTAFDTFTLSISYIFAYRIRGNPSFHPFFDIKLAKRLLRDSWPLIITSMSVVLFMQVDKIMIKHLLGEAEVGLYAAGIRFPEAINFLPMLFASSLFPAILNARAKSVQLYMDRLQRFYFFMTWVGIFVVLVFFFMSDLLIGLYGEAYSSAGIILRVYAISVIFLFQWIARGRWVLAENLQSITFYYMAFGAVVNIVLNFFFIQSMGLIGAAIATVITQFLITLVIPLFFAKMRNATWMLYRSFISWKTT